MEIHEDVIRTGTACYTGGARYEVRIVRTNLRPGTGDDDDSPEIRDDAWGEFYRVDYKPVAGTRFSAGGGYYYSVEEAMHHADRQTGGVTWS